MVKSKGRVFKAFMEAASLVMLLSAAREKTSVGIGLRTYTHTWPKMEFGWRIVLGSIMTCCGAALGSVGGAGSAGIFIPMLTLVIGFDAKSAAALSTCMITGVSVSTTIYNIKKRHPTVDMPMIDYDLATLFQPMLMLGISIGVILNTIFAEWMVTLILIVLCLAISAKAFFKGVEMWKNETLQKEAYQRLRSTELEVNTSTNESVKKVEVSIIENVQWTKVGVMVCVWIAILALQIFKSHTTNCSTLYWVIDFLQIPAVVAASGYEAAQLYRGKSVIASRGERGTNITAQQIVLYWMIGICAGIIGGMVGLGGGVILGPLFLTMQVPPQVTSATCMFAVMFSSSLSMVEFYLLKRFPIPYTLYFVGVATIATFGGQHIVKKLVAILRRESLVTFILAVTFFISAFFIGAEGIINVVHKIKHHEYMGFDSLCSNDS